MQPHALRCLQPLVYHLLIQHMLEGIARDHGAIGPGRQAPQFGLDSVCFAERLLPGMSVRRGGEKAIDLRQDIGEFLLVHSPSDCEDDIALCIHDSQMSLSLCIGIGARYRPCPIKHDRVWHLPRA